MPDRIPEPGRCVKVLHEALVDTYETLRRSFTPQQASELIQDDEWRAFEAQTDAELAADGWTQLRRTASHGMTYAALRSIAYPQCELERVSVYLHRLAADSDAVYWSYGYDRR